MDKAKQKYPEVLVGVVDGNGGIVEAKKSCVVSCKVIQTLPDDVVGVDYNGYGIQVKTKESVKVGDMIEVQVTGKIGTKDFKCRSVK